MSLGPSLPAPQGHSFLGAWGTAVHFESCVSETGSPTFGLRKPSGVFASVIIIQIQRVAVQILNVQLASCQLLCWNMLPNNTYTRETIPGHSSQERGTGRLSLPITNNFTSSFLFVLRQGLLWLRLTLNS